MQQVLEGLAAQLEASKQMYNESLNNLYQVRTSNVMLQQQVQKLQNELNELKQPKEEIAVGEPHPLE